jgi:hypothetical protein
VNSGDIREIFLRFFTEREHARIASASIIPANDPTLLFINAGMAPLKPYFLGEALPPAPDLCNVQPCVRTIDIGDVGDRHHLTFFEMLGSWSIGHYFKDRAVELAFELLTQGFGFPVGKLYVTVFAGDEKLGIAPDEESAAAWERVGVPQDHIVYLGADDNFWSAGDTGPCGPCTEVFYDTGPEHGPAYRPGGELDSAGRYIEIWNAGVFMEFNRLPGGILEPLRFTSVDTGSGLERMAMVLQGRESAYETDLFAPIVAAVQDALAGTGAGQRDVRIVADHIRASTFILSEGVAPSNEGRGYIPRRLLRKAIATATQAQAARARRRVPGRRRPPHPGRPPGRHRRGPGHRRARPARPGAAARQRARRGGRAAAPRPAGRLPPRRGQRARCAGISAPGHRRAGPGPGRDRRTRRRQRDVRPGRRPPPRRPASHPGTTPTRWRSPTIASRRCATSQKTTAAETAAHVATSPRRHQGSRANSG